MRYIESYSKNKSKYQKNITDGIIDLSIINDSNTSDDESNKKKKKRGKRGGQKVNNKRKNTNIDNSESEQLLERAYM